MMKKKGEITSQQIVMLVVLVTSFAILLFFLFRLNLGGETDSELCRNSVLLKGKSVFKDSTLLSCKTKYICLTGDGNCDSTKNLKIEKVKTENDVYQALSEKMTDCWWMFGEGKVDYVASEFTKKIHCSICSQIYLDSSLGNIDGIEGGIKQKKLYEYMSDKKISGRDRTPLQFLFGTSSKLSITENAKFSDMDLGEEYLVIMGIKNKASNTGWIILGGVVVGAVTFFTAPVSIPVLAVLTTAATVGGGFGGDYVATIIQGESGNEFLNPTIIKANSKNEYQGLKCEEIITLS